MISLSPRKMVERLTGEGGMSLRAIGKSLGVSQPTVSRWRDGEVDPRGRSLDGLREIYSERFADDQPEKPARHTDDHRELVGGDIPNLTIHGGMGAGSVEVVTKGKDGRLDPNYVSGYWGLPPEIRAMVPDLQVIHALPVRGDSMYPTLSSGDVVFIDTSHKFPSPPDLYALDYGDGLVVKRLELVPRKNTVRIISDNQRYETYELKRTEIRVYGRVVGRFEWRG